MLLVMPLLEFFEREPQRSRATTEPPPDHSDFTQLFVACTRVR